MPPSSNALPLALSAVVLSNMACAPAAKTIAAAPENTVLVKVAAAELRHLPVEIKAAGKVEAIASVVVRSQVGGVLRKVHFQEGALVTEGALLFEIDPRPFEMAVRQLEAALSRDNAMLAQAEASLLRAKSQETHAAGQRERYEKLAAEGIFSREQAEQAALEARTRASTVQVEQAAVDTARSSALAARSALDNARLNLSYCLLRAPLTGRTGSVPWKPGNLVKAADMELVTIHQVAPVYVNFAVPESRLAILRQRMSNGGLLVRAEVSGDVRGPAPGSVTYIENAVDSSTGTIRIKASFSNDDQRFWPGQFVDLRLLLEERGNAVVVPGTALQTGQAGNFLYVVKSDDRVEVRTVRPGPRSDRYICIEQGLAAGERVVTEGHLRIAPGVKVRAAL